MKRWVNSLFEKKGFKKYLANTSWLILEKMFRLVLGLFVGVWTARYLGPDSFGIVNFAQSFVGMFAIVGTLGLDTVVVRDLVRSPRERDLILGTSFLLKIGGSAIIEILLFAAVLTSNYDFETKTIILIISASTLLQGVNVIDLYCQATVKSKTIVVANLLSLILSSAVKIALILLKASVIFFGISLFLDSVLVFFAFLMAYRSSRLSIMTWRYSRKLAKEMLSKGVILVISSALSAVYMKADQVMLKEIVGNHAVGLYAVAVKLSELWFLIPTVLITSLFPAIISAKSQNKEIYETRLRWLYTLVIWIAVLIAVIISFSSFWLIEFLYGKAYLESVPVLLIRIWGSIFAFIGITNQGYLINENLQRPVLIMTALGMFSNLLLNFILIPRYGVVGAAVAMVVSLAVADYFALLLFKRTRPLFRIISRSFLFR